MAPVTGRVSNRHEDRLVGTARGGERFVAPWIPVDRIGCVLQQIGTLFSRETVHRLDHITKSTIRQMIPLPDCPIQLV
jgi:hypothetical protein